jgi:hypothetical protein
MGIKKNGGPIESTLKNIRNSLFRTKVASICMIVAKGDDILLVTLKNTVLYDLIWAALEQIRVVPKEALHLGKIF